MRTLRFVVEGEVQGVGFRYFARREAQRLGVAGWVRNRRDGAVEGEAAGPDDAVEAFLSRLRRGPAMANVTNVDVTEISDDSERFIAFEIR